MSPLFYIYTVPSLFTHPRTLRAAYLMVFTVVSSRRSVARVTTLSSQSLLDASLSKKEKWKIKLGGRIWMSDTCTNTTMQANRQKVTVIPPRFRDSLNLCERRVFLSEASIDIVSIKRSWYSSISGAVWPTVIPLRMKVERKKTGENCYLKLLRSNHPFAPWFPSNFSTLLSMYELALLFDYYVCIKKFIYKKNWKTNIQVQKHTHNHNLSTHPSTVNVVLVCRVSASARAPSGPMLFPPRLVREGGRVWPQHGQSTSTPSSPSYSKYFHILYIFLWFFYLFLTIKSYVSKESNINWNFQI